MKEPAKSSEDLMVWPKAHQFVLAVYRLGLANILTNILKGQPYQFRDTIKPWQRY
jgi:hypothetical protein